VSSAWLWNVSLLGDLQMPSKSDTLRPEERILFAEFVEYDGELDFVESAIKLANRRLWRYNCVAFAIAAIFLSAVYVGLLAPIPVFAKLVLIIGGICGYIPALAWSYSSKYKWGVYNAFQAMLMAIRKVDPALKSVFASDERTALAKQLLKCTTEVRSFGSRPPFRLHKKIIRQQAIRASRVLQDLVYPAILGNDRELKIVKSILVKAAFEIARSNWVKIGELTVETGHYQAVRPPRQVFRSGQLTTILVVALTAIPAIPILISSLK
jgi:hypothetical protein